MTAYAMCLTKGGTGKSSMAAELVLALARQGRKVLALDLDQQGNLTGRLGITENTPVDYTAADVLRGEASLADAVIPSPRHPNVLVLVGTRELIAVADYPPPDLVTSLMFALRDFGTGSVDDIVTDLQPAAGRMLDVGLAITDEVIAPVASATEAFDQLKTVEMALASPHMKRLNPNIRLAHIVPTLYDGRRLLDQDIEATLRQQYGDRVTKGTVRESVKVKDSYTAGLTLSEYAPTSEVAADILGVVGEILRGTKK
ncbi:ParA family protein [Promicromonospora sukumoe]|uniref:ParA family protein n=1 Tax=Promicromonospora sukumoe TaxID=88382 RepID=UPI0037C653F0